MTYECLKEQVECQSSRAMNHEAVRSSRLAQAIGLCILGTGSVRNV